jgi:hypothetical protein
VLSPLHSSTHETAFLVHLPIDMSVSLLGPLGKDFEGHLANLRAVLVRFREYGLKLKPKKCELFQNTRPLGAMGTHP